MKLQHTEEWMILTVCVNEKARKGVEKNQVIQDSRFFVPSQLFLQYYLKHRFLIFHTTTIHPPSNNHPGNLNLRRLTDNSFLIHLHLFHRTLFWSYFQVGIIKISSYTYNYHKILMIQIFCQHVIGWFGHFFSASQRFFFIVLNPTLGYRREI